MEKHVKKAVENVWICFVFIKKLHLSPFIPKYPHLPQQLSKHIFYIQTSYLS